MTRIETELLVAIVVLYSYDCIYWLAPMRSAFTRADSVAWKEHRNGRLGYTLLGYLPVLADPLLLLPGFIRIGTLPPKPVLDRALTRVAQMLNRHWILELLCRVQAMNLLLFLPWILWTHRLGLLWRNMGAAVLLLHILLMVAFFRVLHRYKVAKWITIAAPLLLNPLGATRALDALSQALFDTAVAQRCSKRTKVPAPPATKP